MTSAFSCIALRSRSIALVLLMVLTINIQAQDCDTRIEEAQRKYEQGQFQQALDLIESCSESEDVQIQWKSLRMQTICFLALKENKKARATAVKLLRINPQYVPSPINDPANLIRLLDDIDIIPTFSMGLSLSIGSNYSLPSASNIHLMTEQKKTYTGRGGMQFGLSGVWQITKILALETELRILEKRFKIDYESRGWFFNYKEKLNYLSLPLGVRYYLSETKRFKPYVRAGMYASRLLFSENSFEATGTENGITYSLLNASSKPRRVQWEWGGQIGLGFVKKFNSGHLFAELQYLHAFNQLNREASRFDYPQLQTDYLYLEDDIKLHSLAFNLGFRLHLNYRVLDK